MIKGFNKEEFLAQPVEARIEQEIETAYDVRGNGIHPLSAVEQTIILNIGGTDYDVRQLVYSLFDLQARNDKMTEEIKEMWNAITEIQAEMRDLVDSRYYEVKTRIYPLEADVYDLKERFRSIDSN